MKLKRYLLFTFDDYYPSGGFRDFAGSFDTIEEASNFHGVRCDNRQIIDTQGDYDPNMDLFRRGLDLEVYDDQIQD